MNKNIEDMKNVANGLVTLAKYEVESVDFCDSEVSIVVKDAVHSFDVSGLENWGWKTAGVSYSIWYYVLN